MRQYQVPEERRSKPCRYHNLNQLERGTITNGCGGKGGWFKGPDGMFQCPCRHHDFNYFVGGSPEDRKKADVQFFQAMMLEAGCARTWFERLKKRGCAHVYYRAVRTFGSKFFHHTRWLGSDNNPHVWLRLERAMDAAGADPREAEFD